MRHIFIAHNALTGFAVNLLEWVKVRAFRFR